LVLVFKSSKVSHFNLHSPWGKHNKLDVNVFKVWFYCILKKHPHYLAQCSHHALHAQQTTTHVSFLTIMHKWPIIWYKISKTYLSEALHHHQGHQIGHKCERCIDEYYQHATKTYLWSKNEERLPTHLSGRVNVTT
jgi:hypothetical protein